KLHGELDDAAGAQAVGAQVYEVLGVGERLDAAGGLDLHVLRAAAAQELDVLARGPAGGKAGGGLDVVRAGVGDDAAERALFLLREEAALDDDLQHMALAGGAHGGDVVRHVAPAAVLDHGQVDDHGQGRLLGRR